MGEMGEGTEEWRGGEKAEGGTDAAAMWSEREGVKGRRGGAASSAPLFG